MNGKLSGITAPVRRVRIQPARRLLELDLREMWAFRDLFIILAVRDIKLRYKQTALGVIWVILQPLVASVLFAVIFERFVKLPSNGQVPYLLIVYAGMLPWNLFAGAIQRAGSSLIGDARLISKVYFPRMIVPIASSAAVLLDFVVALTVLFVLLLIYHMPLTLNMLALPVLLLLTLLISIGISLFISALNVYYRDFMYAMPFITQVWMYASPVVYETSVIPERWRLIYALNPMVGLIDGFRWALIGVGDFPALTMSIALIVGIILFLVGAFVFQRVEHSFADVI